MIFNDSGSSIRSSLKEENKVGISEGGASGLTSKIKHRILLLLLLAKDTIYQTRFINITSLVFT